VDVRRAFWGYGVREWAQEVLAAATIHLHREFGRGLPRKPTSEIRRGRDEILLALSRGRKVLDLRLCDGLRLAATGGGVHARVAVGPSEVTRRMIFEPPSDADPRAGSRVGSPEEAGIDDQWPDEPPTAAPVQLATVPLALPVPTARQRKSSRALKALVAARSGSRRRRSR
jgi:hypothetical protein